MILGTPNTQQAPKGHVLATVNGKPITSEDVAEYIASMGQRGQGLQSPEGQAKVLEQLISQQLIVAEATRNLYDHEPAFQAQLAKVKEDLLFSYALNKLLAPITVAEADVKKYFDEHQDMFVGQPTANASHILVDSEEKALDIKKQIEDGSITFEEAARQFSSCPSKEQGGNLGDFGKGQMVPEFDAACFEMEIGELRGPVKTQFGFHLIRLNSRSESEPMTFEEVKGQLQQQLTLEKQQAAYESKVNQLKILFPVNKM